LRGWGNDTKPSLQGFDKPALQIVQGILRKEDRHLLPRQTAAATATPSKDRSPSQTDFLRQIMDGPLASNAESDHNAEAAAARFQRNLALAFSSDDKEADPPQPPKYTLKSKGFFG